MCEQRWRDGRHTFVPPETCFRPGGYDVVELPGRAEAAAFVVRHHYSRSFPSARFRFGLYGPRGLAGVAVFGVASRAAVITGALPGLPPLAAPGPGGVPRDRRDLQGVELSRFVLLDEVAYNGETWFLARCLEVLAGKRLTAGPGGAPYRLHGVVSFSDPVPRTRARGGDVVFPGHWGTIYQAASAVYRGRTRPDRLLLLPDGTAYPRRTLAKVRARAGPCRTCPGCPACEAWRGAALRLVAAGRELGLDPVLPADPAAPGALAAWLAAWLPRLTRPLAHAGNHRYVFPLGRPMRRRLDPLRLDYPRRPAA